MSDYNLDLSGKVALITGGSRGIGKAIAKAFASKGASVAITYANSSSSAEQVTKEIIELGSDALSIQANSSDFNRANEVIDEVVQKWGKIDILVNNAGITKDGLILRMTEDQWDQVIETNLKGIFNYSKAVARPMMKIRGGSIINMGSIVGLTGNSGQSNYAASKAGLVGFTKSYAKELASRNIRANVLAPGYILTDMTDALDEKVLEGIKEATPLGRAGNVEEVAATCLFLASDLSSYITGEVIRVDGGMAI
ncbi:MAG: 3-oxoacyl-[acyl-carrier-protein] reductase [Bacteroidota bacterium]|nr:3-oxoacyl-[acyl-carrier-protein] reductase [Bacteroidota bacterium]